jgi:3-oxoacyl-[acyl-carrier-protein] synthase-3
LHQASRVSIDEVRKKLDENEARVRTNLHKYGNCTSSSIPLLIFDDLREGNFSDNFIAVGFGVGLSYGSMVYVGESG